MRAPTVFRVGVRGTRLKAECRLSLSHREMLDDARSFGIKGRDYWALTEGIPALIPRGTFAVIFFCKSHLTKGIVAHEMDHAAFCLLSRRRHRSLPFKLDSATKEEETHAYIVEQLVDGFHKKYGI